MTLVARMARAAMLIGLSAASAQAGYVVTLEQVGAKSSRTEADQSI